MIRIPSALRKLAPSFQLTAEYNPCPATFALPASTEVTCGAAARTFPPKTMAASSLVATSRSTPPDSLATTKASASAMNGCARRMRSESARRCSLHASPRWRSRKRRINSGRVVA